MATQAVQQPTTATIPNVVPIAKPRIIIPAKIGFQGDQGSGKTSTASLLAIALSVELHNRAPVHVTDPELGWQFLKPVMYAPEKVHMEQRTVPTFKAMLGDLVNAERDGACVWAVELGKIWTEILKTLRKNNPNNWGSDLSFMWTDFVNRFLSSRVHCLVLGRIQDIVEEVLTESGEIHSVKVGEGMKAGGQKNNFGYEPHMVLRMNLEQRPRTKKGKMFEDEGRMVHRAKVTKDRTWALNGKTFRWQDRDGYRPGDYKYVWESLKPHILAVQLSEGVVLDTTATSESMLSDSGSSEWYEKRERRNAISNEITETLDHLFGGLSQDAKHLRRSVTEHLFGIKSKENVEKLNLDQMERGLRVLQAFEKRCKREQDILGKGELEILAQLDIDIREYDEGSAEEQELPF